jgi:hypothetical protein
MPDYVLHLELGAHHEFFRLFQLQIAQQDNKNQL